MRTKNTLSNILPEKSILYKQLVLLSLKLYVKVSHKTRNHFRFYILVADHCNLKCKSCSTFSPLAEESFLDVDGFKDDMQRIADLTDHNMESILLGGGEPLLHPRLNDIISITRQIFPNVTICLVTNGILLIKQSDTFWETCKANNVYILLSRYPINVEYDKVKEKALLYNVHFGYEGGDNVPIKKMWKYPLDLTGNQPKRCSFDICTQINCNTTLLNGKLYPCAVIPCSKHFSAYFDKNLEITDKDYIDIYNVNSAKELFEFANTPKPFCRYCNRMGLKLGLKYEASKKVIEEWV